VAERGAHVVGVDIAEGMLAAARDLAAGTNLRVEYELADAETLPFPDASFDGVISTFGVMFAGQPKAAAAEIARVCRRGGRLSIVAWLPDSAPVAMRKVLGPYMPPPPSAPPSPFNWGTRDWMTETFGKDFDVGFEEGTVLQREPSAEATWDVYVRGFGPVKAVASALDEARRSQLKSDFVRWADTYRTALGITIPLAYLVTAGVRR
jgi:SAM-dependent methyltransferase